MKKYNTVRLKKYNTLLLVAMLLVGVLFSSCSPEDEIENVSTFTQEMLGEYLEKRPDQFSEFVRLLDTTKVMSLVKAYGKYTMFAPDNEAMHKFYALKGRTSLSQYPLDTLKMIAFDHLIKSFDITTSEFIEGLMPYLTMSDRYIETNARAEDGSYNYYINDNSKILTKNIIVSNGVIHVINNVLMPSTLTLDQAIAKDTTFSLFYAALIETGLDEKIRPIRDESYDPVKWKYLDVNYHQGSGSKDEIPESRKYGFTAFIESNATYASYGITTLEQLKAFAAANVYHEDPTDANVSNSKDPRNSLYKFVGYHLANKKMIKQKIIDMYYTKHMLTNYDMYEYIETLNPNTLIEVRKEAKALGGRNFINQLRETGEAIQIIEENKDNDALNGVYHEIDKMLIYNRAVVAELSSKRIRMDGAAFFPEFTNNNMRIEDLEQPLSWVYPPGYIERLTFSEGTYFSYSNSFGGYLDYQGDEIFLKGLYDFELETPCIPAGTYEVRFGYQPTGARGAAQLYWDGKPCGIPLDLRITANDPLIGWVLAGSDPEDPFGFENDKMMRNRGYMKGPSTYFDHINKWYGGKVARNSTAVARRILGIYNFEKSGSHRFTVKAIREGQFMFDFLEFVPIEVIENEDIQ
jgi:uncharacterized surface protein with fasciclin (FAS1) repeats